MADERVDYTADAVKAAKSVMIELVHILGEYRDSVEDRRKGKDAYDIYFVIQNYPGGLEEVVKAFELYLKMPLVQEGLRKIAAKFASIDHVGPRDATDFVDTQDREQHALLQRDAYEKVNYLLNRLGIR